MRLYSSDKMAFTLAEVLVTLGIIGIVAAMTLPIIVENTSKKETIARLKKVYSELSQAIKLSEADNGPIADWPVGAQITDVNEYFNKYWKPYYKKTRICPNAFKCGYKTHSDPWKNLGGNSLGWAVLSSDSRILFKLSNGIVIFNPRNTTYQGEPSYVNLFYVDVNGVNSPNILGRDVFIFTLSDKKVLRPYGYEKKPSEYNCNHNSGSRYNDCTAKIINDGWQIKADYPWK